jgi:hypothetical protein
MKTDKTSSDQNGFDGSQKTGLLDFLKNLENLEKNENRKT